ncbi:MAG: hypothetical protein O3B47_01540 [bacterium]|nr:hypothetical protein [bacterium]
MCFSATASFLASGFLSGSSALALYKNKIRKHIPIILIPLLFAIQQLIEGIQWLIKTPSTFSITLTYLFLLFAYILWPAYTPLAIRYVEEDKGRKKILTFFSILGIGVSVFLLFHLFINIPTSSIVNGNISYTLKIQKIPFGFILYTIAAAGCCLVSSYKFIRIYGIALILAFIASLYLYFHAWPSTWCFFAAILSTIITYHYIKD